MNDVLLISASFQPVGYIGYFIFLALILYIIYLHIQLNKKDLQIDSMLKTVMDYKVKTAVHDHTAHNKRTHISENEPFDDQTLNFIFENFGDQKIFVHYTSAKRIADSILISGFQFENTFYKTAENVFPDQIDFIYKHNRRKYYGNYIIIICISNRLYNEYLDKTSLFPEKDIAVEQILTEKEPVLDDNDEILYQLPSQFIKGYINYQTGEVVLNEKFNPAYKSPQFDKNLAKLI